MLTIEELQIIGNYAEGCGFRVNIHSENNAKFLLEYIPDYDLSITYYVFDGDAYIETKAEGKAFSPAELMQYYTAVEKCIMLIKLLGVTEKIDMGIRL